MIMMIFSQLKMSHVINFSMYKNYKLSDIYIHKYLKAIPTHSCSIIIFLMSILER